MKAPVAEVLSNKITVILREAEKVMCVNLSRFFHANNLDCFVSTL